MTARIDLSIVIKALNEEAKIAACIESALAAGYVCGRSFEVILADSCSTDRTVEIASGYPIRIVQFKNSQDRGCGAAVQLGYQHARGDFVYLLDGDMKLAPNFLSAAFAVLAENEKLAGVGGLLNDTQIVNAIDKLRVANKAASTIGSVKWLNGGGLYRRSAIETAGGYAGDCNLRAYEEADLGMRLRAAGWRLERLGLCAVEHTGHDLGTFALLRRHWRSRRAMAAGVLLRGALGKPWLSSAMRLLMHPLATLAWWVCVAASLLLPAGWAATQWLVWAALAAVLALAYKKRDWMHVLHSLFHWHYGAAAIVVGLSYPRRDPRRGVETQAVAGSVPVPNLPMLHRAELGAEA